MENNLTSTISPAWPTHWPKNAFKPGISSLLALGMLVLGAIILFGTTIAFALIHPGLAEAMRRLSPSTLPYFIVIQSIAEIPVVALVWLALPRISGFSLRELGFTLPKLNTIGIACLGAILAIIASGILGSVIDAASHTKHTQDAVKMFLQLHDPRQRALFAVFAIVIGPIAEETVFRLFLFNLGLRYFSFTIAAIGSAVLFAAAHLDLYAALPLVAAGFVFAWVYYRSRNAFASMISHGLFNTFAFVVLLVAPKLAS